MSNRLEFRCGHEKEALSGEEVVREFGLGARSFDCPDCQKIWLQEHQFDTAIFVNLQKLSPTLVAYVVEVSHASGALLEVLQMAGYVRSTRSIDAEHPGHQSPHGSVWRKEYWFAIDTSPQHALALLTLLKQEIAWLSTYLPRGAEAVRYWDFA